MTESQSRDSRSCDSAIAMPESDGRQCAGTTGAWVCGGEAAPASLALAFHEGRGPTALTTRGGVPKPGAGAFAGFPCGRTAFGGGTLGVAIGPDAGAGGIALPCNAVAPWPTGVVVVVVVVVVLVAPVLGAAAVGAVLVVVLAPATGTAGAAGAAAAVVVVPEAGEAGEAGETGTLAIGAAGAGPS